MSINPEYEEEVMYLYADFGSKLPLEMWDDRNLYVKAIGMDTNEPIIQINGKIFKGSFEDCVGTNIFFDIDTDNNDDVKSDKFDDQYKYLTKSEKLLRMKRIFVEKSDKSIADDEDDTTKSAKKDKSTDEIEITHSYADALNQLLKPGENPPRNTDEEDELFFIRYGTKIDDKETIKDD